MSSSLECYAVDAEQLWKVFGSNDMDLLDTVLSSCAEQVAEFDADKPARAPSFEEMLETYLAGESPHMAWVGSNREILRTLCHHFGEWLDGEAWSRINAEFVEHIGSSLAAAGAPFELWDLITGGLPENIPLTNPYSPGDAPNCGFASPAQVAEMAEWAKSIDVDDIEDEFDAEAIGELEMWIVLAAQRGHGLVFFYD